MVTYDLIKEKLLDSRLFTGESRVGNRSGYTQRQQGPPPQKKRKNRGRSSVQLRIVKKKEARALVFRASTKLDVSVTVTCLL